MCVLQVSLCLLDESHERSHVVVCGTMRASAGSNRRPTSAACARPSSSRSCTDRVLDALPSRRPEVRFVLRQQVEHGPASINHRCGLEPSRVYLQRLQTAHLPSTRRNTARLSLHASTPLLEGPDGHIPAGRPICRATLSLKETGEELDRPRPRAKFDLKA